MRRNIIETVMGGVVLIVAAGFIALAFRSGAATSPTAARRALHPNDDN